MISDGEFWELFKRVLKKKFVGPDGMPSLQSDDLIRPRKIAVVKSAGALWTRVYINRAVYIWSSDGRRVDYISGHNPGDVSAETPNPWNSSVTGVCKLYTPGEWHIKTPLVTGDVEGERHAFIMSDAALGLDAGNISASEIAGAVSTGENVNVKSIGGVAQTGLDLTGQFAPLVLAAVSPVTAIAATSTSILAASSIRRFVYIKNLEAVGGKRFSLNFGAAAVLDRGMTLDPGDWRSWNVPQGVTQQEIFAIGSGASPAYEMVTG